MRYYIKDGRYWQSEIPPDPAPGIIEVPTPRPSPDHTWNGGEWVISQDRLAEKNAEEARTQIGERLPDWLMQGLTWEEIQAEVQKIKGKINESL